MSKKTKDQVKRKSDTRINNIISEKGEGRVKDYRTFIYLTGILLFTFVLYFRSLNGNILNWDDHTYITENSAIRELNFEHIKQLFSEFYASNYHPLTSLSWAVEYSIGGAKSPMLFHFDNLLLHLLNIILVFLLFKLISKKNSVALLVALFHAIHPMHVESVAWISERKDLLYCHFFLLSMILYCKYLIDGNFISGYESEKHTSGKKKTMIYFSISFLYFLLSLLSKSAAVVLPLMLLLLDYFFRRKITGRMILEKIPFFILSILFGILALRSQEAVINNLPQFTFIQKLLIINHTFLRYIFMAIVPIGLSSYHPWPALSDQALPFIYYIAPLVTLLIISGIVYSLKKNRNIAFGAAFFLVGLILILQFIPVGVAVMAERYSYLPNLGLYFIISVFATELIARKNSPDYLKPVLIILLVFFTAGYSYSTNRRVAVWKSDKNLWDDMISNYPNSAYIAYYNRSKFRHENNNDKGAIEDLTKLIEWKKYYTEALTLRGSILADAGNVSDAINDYNAAIAFDSTYYLAFNNRGSAKIKTNDFSGALSDLTMAIQLKRDYSPAWYNRGSVKISMKDLKGGLDDFNESIRLNPSNCLGYFGKGNALTGNGLHRDAIVAFTAAVSCKPDYTDAYINRGNAKLQLNDLNGAVEDFSLAIQSNSSYSYAWFNRGRVKEILGDVNGAESDVLQSINLNPAFVDAYAELGIIRYNKNDKPGACDAWKKGAAMGSEVCIKNVSTICK